MQFQKLITLRKQIFINPKNFFMKNILILVLGILCLILILDETCVIHIYNMPCECVNDTSDVPDSIPVVKPPVHCNDDARYVVDSNTQALGGRFITKANVDTWGKNFRDANAHVKNKGVYLSKLAIDAMFDKNAEANGLFCYFAFDGNTENKATIIFEAGTSYNFQLANEGRSASLPEIYAAQSMCPDDCGPDAPAE